MIQFGILKKNDLEPISFYASDGKMTQKYVLTPISTEVDKITSLLPFHLISETSDVDEDVKYGAYEHTYYHGYQKMLMTMSLKIIDADTQLVSIGYTCC